MVITEEIRKTPEKILVISEEGNLEYVAIKMCSQRFTKVFIPKVFKDIERLVAIIEPSIMSCGKKVGEIYYYD